ncbi:hypothetical protein WDW86_04260, partial [Bdellovibrionota bacterium FG-2]
HKVRVEHPESYPIETKLVVFRNQSIERVLELALKPATLQFSGFLYGAVIELDSREVKSPGRAPASNTVVQAGDHVLEIARPGCELYRANLTLGGGESKTVNLSEISLNPIPTQKEALMSPKWRLGFPLNYRESSMGAPELPLVTFGGTLEHRLGRSVGFVLRYEMGVRSISYSDVLLESFQHYLGLGLNIDLVSFKFFGNDQIFIAPALAAALTQFKVVTEHQTLRLGIS